MQAQRGIALILGMVMGLSLSTVSAQEMLGEVMEQQQGDRVKDLATVSGVRPNQLTGYGLVVGLDGTGDQTSQTPFTVQSVKNMLSSYGIEIPPNANPQLRNVAAVSLTAELPPFAKPGQEIDVTVSSLGNADSLRGGTLVMAPLVGADGQVYGMAQGNVIVSGFGAEGRDGSRVTVNVPSSGRVPNGATVEREVPNDFAEQEFITLNLNRSDFTTAHRLTETINENFGDNTALPLDSTSVRIEAPADPQQRIAFVSVLENLRVEPGSGPARVIVNSRTGTVVIGANVSVGPAAVSHGSLTVRITERPFVVQPSPFAEGETIVVPRTEIEIEEPEDASMFLFDPGVGLDQIVEAVNEVGAAPGDLVAILEALDRAGALRAQLVVI
ncbi:flagellar P-ring protein precursor FlgI [Natronospira proteinivora]|uniref:Flagellar P-ring protein n=2 Tax=Natronospira proteinivora TaxID=1807133 RepID=A0ABT1G566_9GAMM|nr:flagellar basal body P-ring protein FlgI [Natronospira proteinivora]MCP1726421.1 flagellar P-ring protein precursor FlgI [Natronospira proteinivora]